MRARFVAAGSVGLVCSACGSGAPAGGSAGSGAPGGTGGAGGGGVCQPDPLPSGSFANDWFAACPTMVSSGKTVQLAWSKPPAQSLSIAADPGGTLLSNSTTWKGTLTSPPLTVNTQFILTEAFGEPFPHLITVFVSVKVTP